ncbi:hypothetical protein QBC35DRAFT_192033 [Podospora australis]|uniref:Acetylserotonin methytransferase-like protein n=1 Tax=Podospora australis TaxID=1536484 RepID=A0AAN7AK52_9PEZI|nr:hypothetical protein QBC35DRAFT_192033 [Podospora australis]
MSAPPPMAGGFSLFPNTSSTPRPPSRGQNSRSPPRAASPQGRPSYSEEVTPPQQQQKKQSPLRRDPSVREGLRRKVSNNPWQHALDASEPRQDAYQEESVAGPSNAAIAVAITTSEPVVETNYAQPVTDVPQRCETAFSEAQTLVRSPSQRSRSSIAKPPLTYTPAGQASSSGEGSSEHHRPPQPLRSIFPQYNAELPSDRQDYYPTQASPTHIPQSAISRPLYSPRTIPGPSAEPRSPPPNAVTSPAPTAASASRWPNPGQRHYEPAVIPPVSTTEELRALWKVTNGWKASALEGRNFCLKMTASPDAPLYTLSSAQGQPFYSLRVDPTSASALVSLSRYDPNKPFKSASTGSSSSPNGSASSSPTPGASASHHHSPSASLSLRNSVSVRASKSDRDLRHDAKHWLEVLSTQLEPAIRKQPLNDGLVAQLWPAAAARLVADRANDATTVALAQQESARLVWDSDSGNHFLVHPALAMPFCVTVERHPAYSRTEYTLEHLESPVHLAKLTRDGTGAGWLEVDTAIASKIDAVYLVDVVTAALILVAHADEAFTGCAEVFEPPPVLFGGPNGSVMAGSDGRRSSSRSSRRAMGISSRASRRESKKEEKERKKSIKKAKHSKKSTMEQFEIDLESQDSQYNDFTKSKEKEKDKVPAVLRALVWVIKVLFKCVLGSLTLILKMIGAIFSGCFRCCGLGKL